MITLYIKEAETNFFYYNTEIFTPYCYLKYNCHLLKSVANLIPLRAVCVVKSKAQTLHDILALQIKIPCISAYYLYFMLVSTEG